MTAPKPGVENFPKEEPVDEQRKGEEPEIEAHSRQAVNLEPVAEGDDDNDVEAHVRQSNVRMDSPRQA